MGQQAMVASGLQCPRCKKQDRQEILEWAGPLRLRVRCLSCEAVWWEEL